MMKKILLLATSALLLLAGCAKEAFTGPEGEGGLQQVTFTASMAGDATKAAADGDGAAASVNRCIMEIYYDGSLFERKYAEVTSKVATFSTQLVAGRTYTVAFWADSVASRSALSADLYYTTNAAQPNGGLQAIALKGTYAGNDDARDAFFHSKEYTIAQAGSAFNATLYRPFAQVNVITTDADVVRKVTTLKPTFVNVNIKNAFTGFNALTGDVSTTSDLTYSAAVYNSDFEKRPSSDEKSVTLSMDYLFAATDKAVIDIDWKAGTGDFTVSDASFVSHSFSNIPYQRNYRTNIKGNLLTSQGQWTVTVDPAWETPEADVKYASTLAQAQEIVQTANTNAVVVEVKQEAVTNATTGDVVEVGGQKYLQFILKTTSPNVVGFDLPAITSEDKTRLGTDTWLVTYEPNYPTTNVTVDAPEGTRVKIQAPTSHVEVTGTNYSFIFASTGDNSLVIPKGTHVTNLHMYKGGLEVHGTLGAVAVVIENDDKVYVRACEGLTSNVYNNLKSYIDVDNGYVGEQESGKETYKVYKGATQIAKIGEKAYYVLQTALDEVAENQTIELTSDITQSTGVHFNKDVNATLDLKGFTFKVTNDTQNSHRAIKVQQGTLTIKNGTIDARNVDENGDPQAINLSSGYTYGMYGTIRVEGTSPNVVLKDLTLYNNHCFGMSVKVCTGATASLDNCIFNSEVGGCLEAEGGTATVSNSTLSQTGAVSLCAPYASCGIAASYQGNVTVESSTISDSAKYPLYIYNSTGTITVNGGTFTSTDANGYAAWADGTLYNEGARGNLSTININAGTFNGQLHIDQVYEGDASIKVKGGTFDHDPSDFVVEGYKAEKDGDVWKVEKVYMLKNVTKGTNHDSLQDLFNNASDGDSLIVLNSYTDEDTYGYTIKDKAVTLDLNSKTITLPCVHWGYTDAFKLDASSVPTSLTITDSSEGKSGKIIFSGTTFITLKSCTIATAFNLKHGTITCVGPNNTSDKFICDSANGSITINGGKIIRTDTKSSNPLINLKKGNATVNGGELATEGESDKVLVQINGGTLNVTGGKLKSQNTTTSTSVTEYSSYCIENKTGTLNVSGGELSSYSSVESYTIYCSNYGTSTTTITGGTFIADNNHNNGVTTVRNFKRNSSTSQSCTVSGGTFKVGSLESSKNECGIYNDTNVKSGYQRDEGTYADGICTYTVTAIQ